MSSSARAKALRGRLLPRVVQSVVRALWLFVVPALLAALTLRFLVPPTGAGFAGWLAGLGHGYPVLFLASAFLVFSALAHYWRFHVWGGRYASPLAAHIASSERDAGRLRQWAELAENCDALSSRATRRYLAAVLDTVALEAFDERIEDLQTAILSGDAARAKKAADQAATVAAPALALGSRKRILAAGLVIAFAAGSAVFLRARIGASYQVLSSSMLPTLEPLDRIAANKRAYRGSPGQLPGRGDIIVFHSTAVPSLHGPLPDIFIKRVIGLPGDRVAVQGGTPIVNGWTVPTCDAGEYLYVLPDGEGDALHGRVRVEFLAEHAYLVALSLPMPGLREPYLVGAGEVFVLGDNRSNSVDSRSWNEGRGGGVPLTGIEGRAQWFLVGTHPSGDADFGRFLGPLDVAQGRLHVEGVDATAIEEGIARCMRNRPPITLPPTADAVAAPEPQGAAP